MQYNKRKVKKADIMTIKEIKKILDNHGVPNYTVGDKIFADSMISTTEKFEVVEDVTKWSRKKLYIWLGY